MNIWYCKCTFIDFTETILCKAAELENEKPCDSLFFEIFLDLVRGHIDELELEHAADLCKPLVLLLRVIIFRQINEIHDRLGCQQQMLVQRFDL
jgi:hypothetical protein